MFDPREHSRTTRKCSYSLAMWCCSRRRSPWRPCVPLSTTSSKSAAMPWSCAPACRDPSDWEWRTLDSGRSGTGPGKRPEKALGPHRSPGDPLSVSADCDGGHGSDSHNSELLFDRPVWAAPASVPMAESWDDHRLHRLNGGMAQCWVWTSRFVHDIFSWRSSNLHDLFYVSFYFPVDVTWCNCVLSLSLCGLGGLQHFAILLKYIIHVAIPDIPGWVAEEMAKLEYRRREAFKV